MKETFSNGFFWLWLLTAIAWGFAKGEISDLKKTIEFNNEWIRVLEKRLELKKL
jgi:hypothetical protein